jgi:hypothetical protein
MTPMASVVSTANSAVMRSSRVEADRLRLFPPCRRVKAAGVIISIMQDA